MVIAQTVHRPSACVSRPHSIDRSALETRARRLASTEIAYIDHPEFRKRRAEAWLASLCPPVRSLEPTAHHSTPGMAFVAGLVRAPLLTPQEEQYLFLLMNYRKSQAERWRRKIRLQDPDPALLDQIDAALEEALQLRNRIAEANLRLIVAAAKKMSHSLDQLSELTSEGLLPILRAVELFDVSRGNRFSTYATWAVRNQMLRSLQRQRSTQEIAASDQDEAWSDLADVRTPAGDDERRQLQRQALLERLIRMLPEREQQLVAARFGLHGEPSGQSLAEIADRMGLSKERVRQIVLGALQKLRDAVSPADLEWEPAD